MVEPSSATRYIIVLCCIAVFKRMFWIPCCTYLELVLGLGAGLRFMRSNKKYDGDIHLCIYDRERAGA